MKNQRKLNRKTYKKSEEIFYRELTPELLKRILNSAKAGYMRDLCVLGKHILSSSFDIGPLWGVRRGAIASLDFEVLPSRNTRRARLVAETVEAKLTSVKKDPRAGLIGFRQMLKGSVMANYYGYRVYEIEWNEDGSEIFGFRHWPESLFSIDRDNDFPYLRRSNPRDQDQELPEDHFFVHTAGDESLGGDGLIGLCALIYLIA